MVGRNRKLTIQTNKCFWNILPQKYIDPQKAVLLTKNNNECILWYKAWNTGFLVFIQKEIMLQCDIDECFICILEFGPQPRNENINFVARISLKVFLLCQQILRGIRQILNWPHTSHYGIAVQFKQDLEVLLSKSNDPEWFIVWNQQVQTNYSISDGLCLLVGI